MKRKKFLGVILLFLVLPIPAVLAQTSTVEMEYDNERPLHAPKKVNNIDYQYDLNGNLVNDGERVISWNQDNMPTRIEKDGKIVEFFYDADGRKIAKKIGENKTVYVNQYYQLSASNSQLSPVKYYFAGNRRIAQSTEILICFHQDQLGSTILTTDSDSQPKGEILIYFPYGNTTSNQPSAISNYLFTDQELDQETGLYNYKARLYNPQTGSFISGDILDRELGNSQKLNRYAYVEGNPVRFTDPSGLQVPDGDVLSEELWLKMLSRERNRQKEPSIPVAPQAPVEQASFEFALEFALFMKGKFPGVGVTAELWEAVQPEAEELFGEKVTDAITQSVGQFPYLQCLGFTRACVRAMGGDLPAFGEGPERIGIAFAGSAWHGSAEIEKGVFEVEAGDILFYRRKTDGDFSNHWAVVSGQTDSSVTLIEAMGTSFRFGEISAPAGGIMVNERTFDLSTGSPTGTSSERIVDWGFYRLSL